MASRSASRDNGEGLRVCGDERCVVSIGVLLNDFECPAFIADGEGRYRVANEAFCELLGAPAERVVGSRLSDWFTAEIAAERMAMREHVKETGRAVHAADLLRGKRFTIVMRPFEVDGERPGVVALLQPRPPRNEEVESGLYPLSHFDLGMLAELTPRELEVLQLIGQGNSQREIATRIGRTVKTVEAHRAAVGKKLGARKNVHLVQIAMHAGMLDPADSPRLVAAE
jgi:DNA-binding CsgD family transcriptional regulator